MTHDTPESGPTKESGPDLDGDHTEVDVFGEDGTVDMITEVVEEAAVAAGDEALNLYREGLEVDTKDGKTDYVTQADHRAQETAVSVLRELGGDYPIVGEEGKTLEEVPKEGGCWIIDPIDGTSNFVRGMPVWTTSVAFVMDGEPVASANYIPVTQDLYVAGEEVTLNGTPVGVSEVSDHEVFKVVPTVWWGYHRRDEYSEILDRMVREFGDMLRIGSVQAVLSMVASGSVDAAVTNVDVNPWDSVAGVHMVRQAGGKVTDTEGEPWSLDSVGLVASNGESHEAVVDIVRSV